MNEWTHMRIINKSRDWVEILKMEFEWMYEWMNGWMNECDMF